MKAQLDQGRVRIHTLSGHSFLLSYDRENDSFEVVMRKITQHMFPDFDPKDSTYSNHVSMFFEGARRVTSQNFEARKSLLQAVGAVIVILASSEIKSYLKEDKSALESLNNPNKADQPNKSIYGIVTNLYL